MLELLTPEETAQKLKLSTATLAVWRATRRYPQLKYIVLGGAIRYSVEDVARFLAARTSDEFGRTAPGVKRRPPGSGRPVGKRRARR